MAKFFILAITLHLSIGSISQETKLPEFNFENYDFPKSIVINVDGESQSQLKEHIQNWLNSYYSKSSLLESKYSDHSFFLTARENRLLKIKNLTSDLIYELKISLRDNKYRLEISSLKYKYYTEFRPIENVNLIKDEIIRKDLLDSRSTLFSFFKDLNLNLFNSIKTNTNEW